MKGCSALLLVIIPILTSTGAEPVKKWQSPDKFYSIELPADWAQVKGERDIQTFVFKSPGGEAEIDISTAYDLHLPETLPTDILELAFEKDKGLTEIARIRGHDWDGLKREYINAAQTQRWSAIAARNGSTIVLLTMTAPAIEFARFEDVFKRIGESLQLGK
jgi:hypothetical protein